MSIRRVRAPQIDFTALRRELELPDGYPPGALREAERVAAAPPPLPDTDRTDLALVTVDPPASMDLDQAVRLERRSGGYRVYYAIADVAGYVPPAGELAAETWRRGETIYLPDGKVPLHPTVLSEGAASLLPDQVRAAVLWTVDLDADGAVTGVDVRRAAVRSRAKLDYAGLQAAVDAGGAPEPVALLPEVGRLLLARGVDRGAISLPIPEQEVEPDGTGWRLVLRATVPVEEYNAQISLLTGMAAARIMLDGRVGLLRTMPDPRPEAIGALRAAAASLGIAWMDGTPPGAVLAAVQPGDPRGAAFVDQASELMRGAGYTAFDGQPPEQHTHGAVAAPYAHVTAPLRRLADRYATEVCLALASGHPVPDWARAALPELPAVMTASGRRASAAERGAVDLTEAVLLAGRVGEWFDAAVLDVHAPAPRIGGNDGRQYDVPGGDDSVPGFPAPAGARPGPRKPDGESGTADNGPRKPDDNDKSPVTRPDRAAAGGGHARGEGSQNQGGTRRNPGGTVAIDQPPVRARCDGADLPLGRRVRVRLVTADPQRREVLFEYPGPGAADPATAAHPRDRAGSRGSTGANPGASTLPSGPARHQ